MNSYKAFLSTRNLSELVNYLLVAQRAMKLTNRLKDKSKKKRLMRNINYIRFAIVNSVLLEHSPEIQ